MPANPPTKQAARLPKPSVMYTDHNCGAWHDRTLKRDIPAALIPCRTITEARALIRVAGFFAMGEAEQIDRMACAMYCDDVGHRRKEPYWAQLVTESPENAIVEAFRSRARAVLTLIASGGGRK